MISLSANIEKKKKKREKKKSNAAIADADEESIRDSSDIELMFPIQNSIAADDGITKKDSI